MGIARRFLATALAVMIASCMGATAAFADTAELSGVSLVLSADKAGYASGDAAEFTWKLENGTDKPLADVQMKLSLPAGMVAADGAELEFPVDDVAAGETAQGTVKALVPDTSLNPALSSTGDPLSDLPVGAVLAALAALACLIVVAARKGDVFRGPLCALLALALVAGMCPAVSLAEPAYADEQKNVSLSAKQIVTVNGAEATATLDATFGATIEGNQVSFYLTYDEYVKNPDDFKAYWVADGALLEQPATPLSYIGEFDGWYADLECTQPFDFAAPVTEDVVLVAKWALDETDSDSDGLTDGIEECIGSDPSNPDTDGDGLPDGVETRLATNVLKVDTDADGTSDFDEDYDGDGLKNGSELDNDTDPVNPDSDCDDLPDGREADEVGSDPLKEDTDGDGASDGLEVACGSDPLTFNASIRAVAGSTEASEDAPVVASVSLNLTGEQLSTLKVRPVSVVDDPLVSPSIAGYMGRAYDFTVEGTFNEATITFTFDEATFGAPDEDFKPAIFYVNAETGTLDKLPNQSISGNKVSVTTTHFSTYILLNEVPFDKVWAADIKPPVTGNDESTRTDIVFCIDHSMSMNDNDPHYLRLDVTENFIDKLRGGFDKVGVVKFINPATTVCELTGDMSAAKEAVRGIVNDDGKTDGVSGTNGSAGLLEALRVIESSTAPNKYIVFLTDGQDTYPRNDYTMARNYAEVMNEAENNKVAIYTIGLGDSVNTSRLTQLADFTGGEYYNAKAGLDLDDVYSWIEHDTVDLVADSNKDGIPDYYNTLIKNGTLVLSNGSRELVGIDFNYDRNGNPSNDYDGDGVVNGKEIELVVNEYKGSVYLKMNSNPVHKAYSSITLPTAFDKDAANELLDDSLYEYVGQADYYRDYRTWLEPYYAQFRGVGITDCYEAVFLEYITEYSFDSGQLMEYYERRELIEFLEDLKGEAATDAMDELNSALSLAYDSAKDTAVVKRACSAALEAVKASNPELGVWLDTDDVYGAGKEALRIGGYAWAGLSAGFSIAEAWAAYDKIASIESSNACYSQVMEMLNCLRYYGGDSEAKAAASLLYFKLTDNYGKLLDEAISDGLWSFVESVAESAIYKHAITALIAQVPSIWIGDVKTLRERYSMIACMDLSMAYARSFRGAAFQRGSNYVTGEEDFVAATRSLTDLAQVRLLGEYWLAQDRISEGFAGVIGGFTGSTADFKDKYRKQKYAILDRTSTLRVAMCSEVKNLNP